MSSSSRHGDVLVHRFDNGKANAIDDAFLDELDGMLDELGSSQGQGVRALVVTGYDRFFSAGLALPALIGRDRAGIEAFITRFSVGMLRLYACPLPVVAAINGHAIAGGCVLALMADVRLMAEEGGKIGLNEVQLGIGLPSSVLEPLRAAVPAASLVPIALEGRLSSAAEAKALGLVDEVVPRAQLEARALERASALAELPAAGLAQIKEALRRPVLDAARARAEVQTGRWVDSWFSGEARARITAVVAKLARPS